MVSVKLLDFFVAVAMTVVEPSAGTLVLSSFRSDTRGIVVNTFDADVVSVPIDTVVTNRADTDTVFAPLLLCVTVLDFVAKSCADVDVLNVLENEYAVPSIVMVPLFW